MDLFKLFGTIIINNSEAISEIRRTTEEAQTAASSIGSKMTSAGKAMVTVGTALAPVSAAVTAVGTASVWTAANFSDSMLKVQSLTGGTDEDLAKLTNTAKEFGATTAWSAKDVADAMGYMALAGFDTNEIVESTSGMLSLASASGEDLATVTDILTDSMTAFGNSASDAGRFADVLATVQAKSNTTVGMLGDAFKYVAPLAGSFGYSVEQISVALGSMANAGIKGSMAGTALRSILTRLGTNTNGARTAIEELGVEFYNENGTARSLATVMKELCDATKDMTVAQKEEFAQTVAGQEAQNGLLAILNQGSEAYWELEKAIYTCDGSASDMADNMESGLGGAIRSFKSALEGVSITLGETLAPYITAAADKIKALCTWFQNLSPATQDMIVKIGMFVAALSPVLIIGGKLIGGIGSLITNLGTIKSAMSLVGTGAKALWAIMSANPVGAVIAILGALVVAFVTLWNKSEAFRNFWIGLWENIKSICSSAVEGIKGFFSGLNSAIDGVKAKFAEVQQGISDKMTAAKETVSNALSAIKGFFDGLSLKLPHIALPHFAISGTLSLNPPSVPHISIEWYKNGGILTDPTVFGFHGMNPMVGGEAGAEAIAPIDVLQGYVSSAVASQNKVIADALDRIYEAITAMDENMGNNMKTALDGTSLSVNNREFARMVKGVV